MAQKARKDGRVLLSVAMMPDELEAFEQFAQHHSRSRSEQARVVLVEKVTAWKRRLVNRLTPSATRKAAKPKLKVGF